LDIVKRTEAESALAQAADIAENDVVIDIPERIKLETDLMVHVDNSFEPFDQRSTLFCPNIVEKVAEALRTIRIYIRPIDGIDSSKIASLVDTLLD